MLIRTAQAEDAAQIAAIWNLEITLGVSTFNSVSKPVEEISELIDQRGAALIVAEAKHDILGFATWGQFRRGAGYRHSFEHTLHLREIARGKGIGRALMRATEAGARRDGAHALVAGIAGENRAGVVFHEKMGFEQVGRLPEVGRKFDRWMDLVLMLKLL
ncbi:N-acetyltransferase family protein [Pseudopelagicola sp. nBUS_20]|uniref:GNAT family N-acetyltransferase n=1 Tax=Pseudopelagicola sp. nBUS_20 TaxID=3395317 RepID=UPI003EBB432C